MAVVNRLLNSQGWTWTSCASLHIQQLHWSPHQIPWFVVVVFLYNDTLFSPLLLCFQFSCSPTRPSDHWSWTLRFSWYRVETSTQCTNLQWMHSEIQVWIPQHWWQRLEGKTKHGLFLLNLGYCSAFTSCIDLCLDFKEKWSPRSSTFPWKDALFQGFETFARWECVLKYKNSNVREVAISVKECGVCCQKQSNNI